MHNPFEILMEKLNQIENLIKSQNNAASDNVMNVEQLANYLDLSKSHIYKKTSSKEIPHYKKGKKLYFSKQEINQWILQDKIETFDKIEQKANEYLTKNRFKNPFKTNNYNS